MKLETPEGEPLINSAQGRQKVQRMKARIAMAETSGQVELGGPREALAVFWQSTKTRLKEENVSDQFLASIEPKIQGITRDAIAVFNHYWNAGADAGVAMGRAEQFFFGTVACRYLQAHLQKKTGQKMAIAEAKADAIWQDIKSKASAKGVSERCLASVQAQLCPMKQQAQVAFAAELRRGAEPDVAASQAEIVFLSSLQSCLIQALEAKEKEKC